MKITFFLPILTLLFACGEDAVSSTKENQTVQIEAEKIDRSFIDYLSEYQMNTENKVVFERIGNTTYWVTSIHGAGTQQEYYWENKMNRLTPKFTIEYGGMDWDAPLDFTLISIENKDTLTGKATLDEITLLKKSYIEKNEK